MSSIASRRAVFPLPYALLGAVLVAFGLYAVFISGPVMRTQAQEQLARIIADEDRAVCGTFGIRAESSKFPACAQSLAMVRQKQAERDRAADQGIL